jgi:hypothetical protein
MKHLLTISAFFFGAAMLNAKTNGDKPQKSDTHADAMAGWDLTPNQVAELEAVVAKSPENLSARTKLLGYYFAARHTQPDSKDACRKHVLWIIKNRPEAEVAGTPYCQLNAILDANGYHEAKQLWSDQTKAHAKDSAILGHAAQFLFLNDRTEAETLLKQAKSLEAKNPKWSDQLAHLYAMRRDKDGAAKAWAEYERAQSIDDDEMSRFHRLSELAKSAYDAGELQKAAKYADESLKARAKYYPGSGDGNSVHYANIVLGRIALKRGDAKHAGEFLLKAGQTPGSPNLDSFGPNMSLAKELLEAGEKETVLQYFELCRKFWTSHGEILDDWTKEVKAGQIPEFGANLVY